MIHNITVPHLSANVDNITVTQWLKEEGVVLAKDEPVVEVTTDKASFEIEAPEAGTLRKIIAVEKSIIPIGYIMINNSCGSHINTTNGKVTNEPEVLNHWVIHTD